MTERVLGAYTHGEPVARLPLGDLVAATHRDRTEPCVLLLLPHDLATNLDLRRSLRSEVRTVQAVDRPEIARPIELGHYGQSVFEIYQAPAGVTLARRLERGESLNVQQVISLVTALAETLDAVHPHGIVHGHLSPETAIPSPDCATISRPDPHRLEALSWRSRWVRIRSASRSARFHSAT